MLRLSVVLLLLISAGAHQVGAQGIGRPPLFDPAAGDIRNTLQFEGAVAFDDAAPWFGSTGLRVRRDWPGYALAAGAALLSARDPGYAVSLSAQYKPGLLALVGEAEKALWVTGGPIVDLARQASDPIGQYSVSGAFALVFVLGVPGLTAELSAAPHYTLRSTTSSDITVSDHAWGIQTGLVAGVARFVQLLFTLDWSNHGVRPPGPFEDSGTWTLGLGLRTRLPGT